MFDVIIEYYEKKLKSGIYNLGSNKIVSKYSLLEALAESLGKDKYLKRGRSGIENLYQITNFKNSITVKLKFKDYVSRYLDEIKTT